MKTSVALLAVFLLCFAVAEAQYPENQEGKGETGLISDIVPAVNGHNPGDVTSIYCILRKLEAKLRDNERQLEDLKRERKCNQVAFGAAIDDVRDFGPFNTHVKLVYKKVFANTGEYNPATGIFTAPVRGFYHFSFTGYNQSTRRMALLLMKNGKHMVSINNHRAGNRYESATNGMTLQLEVGDKVYISLGAHTWIHDNSYDFSTFIGHLLFCL